jgi:hypothetical protein
MQVGEERVEWQDEGAQAVYMNDTLGAWTGIAPHFMQVRHRKRDTVRERHSERGGVHERHAGRVDGHRTPLHAGADMFY